MGRGYIVCAMAAVWCAWTALGQQPEPAAEAPMITPDAVHPVWQDFEPAFEPIICPFYLPGTYDREEFQCGYVLVPEDRTHSGSRLIQLMVMKIASTSETPPGGALMELTGGPGGPSLAGWRVIVNRRASYGELRATADLIYFDQRGTGHSEGRFCRGALQAYQFGLPPRTEGLEAYMRQRRECLAEARQRGVFVDGYTTWQNALDVRDIRRALGYDSWTVYGVSYGSELGQAVMRFDSAGTRAAVLDSVVPAGFTTSNTQLLLGNGFRSALDGVDEMCAADPGCRREFPDGMAQRFVDAIQAYDEDPLELSGLANMRAITGRLYLDGSLAGSALFQALYDKAIYGDLPAFLRVMETRDEAALRTYVNEIAYRIDHAYGYGMALTINCRAGFRETPGAAAPPGPDGRALVDLVGAASVFQRCGDIYDAAPDPSVAPLVSDIPTLVVTGAVDPITPPYYADVLMEGLTGAQRVDFPNTGHGGLSSNWEACGRDLLIAFLKAPDAPLDARCADETPPPDFLVGLRETKQPFRFARRLQSGTYPLVAGGAAGGLAVLVAGFLLAPIARRVDGRPSGDYGRARLLASLGALASLGGIALGVQTILSTGLNHSASLVIGVPGGVAWAGWLGVAGCALCLVALWRMAARWRSGQALGTRLALLLAPVLAATALWFLFSIGAGPV
ncbi:MAG: alpha/beta fold hydrolase [Pseudomonadota bacterium]